jgi:NADH dehydrogenase
MKRILIIGGGFAGCAALKRLSRYPKEVMATLIDRKKEFNFLPLLPDLIGRGLEPRCLILDIESLVTRKGFCFVCDEVVSVDAGAKMVSTGTKQLPYDFLLIASGSETNFYDNEELKAAAYKIDEVADAEKIVASLTQKKYTTIVISGGGYTGIEVATNLISYCRRSRENKRVVIVEFAPSLLGVLPQGIRNNVQDNLKRLGIEALLGCTVLKATGSKVHISNGMVFDEALLIWTAGVKTSSFVQQLPFEKNRQGRLKVDEYLRVQDDVFAAGDATAFLHHGNPLRMAVQFSILQGEIAADNMLRLMRNAELKKFKPLDLGYIIPMANNRSYGLVGGIYVKGILATLLHYLMCVYRLPTLRNKVGLMRTLRL